MRHLLFILAAVATNICTAAAGADGLPAFPGAEGFGSTTPGGRGGRVYFVTTLADYRGGTPIEGSFRAACEAEGPRIVIFQVSGTIALENALKIRNPFITIAGQTAPGDGICLRNYTFTIETHDVVIRHLRVRPGDETALAWKQQGKDHQPDGISVYVGSRNVVLDHCSVGWAVDECLSVTGDGVTDVTVQWCLISESLNRSVHDKGSHGYGSLIRTNGNITYHHNLYAHHSSRCPRPGTYGDGSILLDFCNNGIYDGVGYSAEDPVRMNYVGNYIRRSRKKYAFQVGGAATKLFVADNLLVDRPETSADPWSVIDGAAAGNRASEPFAVAPVTTQSPTQAWELLLASCGATLPRRDDADRRVIEQARGGTGDLIDSQSQVGGWPELRSAEPPPDADSDGMPDDWETVHGFDPQNPADAAQDANGDGYTNLEQYLNSIGG